jgi:hypothetical protein
MSSIGTKSEPPEGFEQPRRGGPVTTSQQRMVAGRTSENPLRALRVQRRASRAPLASAVW